MWGFNFPIITEMDFITKLLSAPPENVLKWWKQWHHFDSYWHTLRFGTPLEFHLLFLLHSFAVFCFCINLIFTSNPLYTLQIFNFQLSPILDSARSDWKEFQVLNSLELSWNSTGCQRNHQTHYKTMANSNASIHGCIKLFSLCSSFQHFHSFIRTIVTIVTKTLLEVVVLMTTIVATAMPVIVGLLVALFVYKRHSNENVYWSFLISVNPHTYNAWK